MRWRIRSAAQANRFVETSPKVSASGGAHQPFKRYLLMAIGSADEMQVWLRYCSDLEYIDRKVCAMWRDEYRQIAKMLQGLYTALGVPSDP